jgi:hypothetical protein
MAHGGTGASAPYMGGREWGMLSALAVVWGASFFSCAGAARLEQPPSAWQVGVIAERRWPSRHGNHRSQGLMTGTRVSAKSATLRVTMILP